MNNNPSHIKLIQSFEQASAILEPFGNFISVYFKSLIENGFERQEALKLVEKFQTVIWEQAFKQHESNEE
jgi:hypothetical protein